MPNRQRLPMRRLSENFNFECGGLKYTATIGKADDGTVQEIFINNHKINSMADVAARNLAVVCSIALQYHVPIETIRTALMRDMNGNASGPLGVVLDMLANEGTKQ